MQLNLEIKKAWKMLIALVGNIRTIDYPVFSVTGNGRGGYFSAKVEEDDNDVVLIYPALSKEPSCKIDNNKPIKIRYKDFKIVAERYRDYIASVPNIREAMRNESYTTTYVISLIECYNLDKVIYLNSTAKGIDFLDQ